MDDRIAQFPRDEHYQLLSSAKKGVKRRWKYRKQWKMDWLRTRGSRHVNV